MMFDFTGDTNEYSILSNNINELDEILHKLGKLIDTQSHYYWQMLQIKDYLSKRKSTMCDEETKKAADAYKGFIEYIKKVDIRNFSMIADLDIYEKVLDKYYYFNWGYMLDGFMAFNPELNKKVYNKIIKDNIELNKVEEQLSTYDACKMLEYSNGSGITRILVQTGYVDLLQLKPYTCLTKESAIEIFKIVAQYGTTAKKKIANKYLEGDF